MVKKTKKTKKQIAIETRIKGLKKQHDKLSKQQKLVGKKLSREWKIRKKKLNKLAAAVERAQAVYDKLDEKDLPSEGEDRKLRDKLYRIEDQIRMQQRELAEISNPSSDTSPPNFGEE